MAVTWSLRCALWGIVSSGVAAILFNLCLSSETRIGIRIVAGLGSILLGLSSLIALHIASLRCSESHTLKSLLMSYMWHERERHTSLYKIAKATNMWKHAREAQENLIRRLTRLHAKTEYGRKNHLEEIRSLEKLREVHPLTTYDHYKDYIQRLADGEQEVFLGEQPVRFGITTGTTGAGKPIPYGGFFFDEESFCFQLMRLATYQATSRPSPVQKRCFLYTHPTSSYTKSGLVISIYTFITKNDIFFLSEQSSPPPTFTITSEPATSYIHMLFAIADPNLAVLSTLFTPKLYCALKELETNWEAMLEDLSTGKLNSKLPLAPKLHKSLEGYLRPDQDRVNQLRKEFQIGFEGIVRRIWPHLVAVEAVDVGGSWKKLVERYTKGVPLLSRFYGTTESGTPGINMSTHGDQPRYVLQPLVVVFEFIPEQNSSGKTLFIDEVEIGGEYELVITTRTGLYRYRTGDVVKVVGFHEKCPVIQYMYRTGENLNLVYEKMNSQVLSAVVDATVVAWPGLDLVNWTCAESPLFDPGNPELYYMLFVEVHVGNGNRPEVTEEQKSKFDELLQQSHYFYRTLRAASTIFSARVYLVKPDTFKGLRDLVVSSTTSSAIQYKTPRKLRTLDQVKLMMERVYE